jgi:hypothetical protein
MSVKALTWALKQNPQSPAEKMCLVALADACEGTDFSVSISLSELADRCSASPSHTRSLVSSLEFLRFIFKEPQVETKPKLRILPTLYRLNIDREERK